jgi:DNA end-binding protein Ku
MSRIDGKAGNDAFIVIRDAMQKSGKVALGRVVIGTRERLIAIEPRGRGMLVTTLRSHEDIRDTEPLFDGIPQRKSDQKMIVIAEQIIDQLAGPFDPTQFNDRYEEALRALIRDKQAGSAAEVTAPPPREDNVIDLMDALRRSLEKSGKAEPVRKPQAKAKQPVGRKRAAGKRAAAR